MGGEYSTTLSSMNLSLSKIAQSLSELVDLGKEFNSLRAVEHAAAINVSNDRITEAMVEVYREALRHRSYAVGPCILYDGTGIMITVTDVGVHTSDPFTPSIAPFTGRCNEEKTMEFITSECSATANPRREGEYLVDEEVLIKAMIRNGFSFY